MTNKKKSKRKGAASTSDKDDEAPPAITYYHDTFHKLLLLLNQCVTNMHQNDTSSNQSGVSEWFTWAEAGLLKPKSTLLTILKVMGIAQEHKSIIGAFHYLFQRIPCLADYIVSTDNLSDDSITVSVYDEPKRRSARLQQSTTVLQTVDDNDTSSQGVKNAKMNSSDKPPNVDHDE